MVGSLFLTIAMAWLTGCDDLQSPNPAVEAVYMVGDDAGVPKTDVNTCGEDDEMCSGAIIDAPAKPARFVAIEFCVLHTPSKLAGVVGNEMFLNSEQVQAFMTTLNQDPHAQLFACPKMILCSGQEGMISIGSCVPKGVPCAVALPLGSNITFSPFFPEDEFEIKPPAKQAGLLDGLTLKAMPRVSANGRYIELTFEGTTCFCPCGECCGANQVITARLHGTCADGKTIVLQTSSSPAQPCSEVPVLAGLPIIGELFQVTGAKPENVVMMATVHIVDQAGHPVAQTSCTRDCETCLPPVICPNPLSVATVESNLEHLQRAKELYELAHLYERLNQFDVANKICLNIQEICPHSRIALKTQSELLREAQKQWERVWFTDQPSQVDLRQGGEESEAPVKLSKLDQVLCGYRQACSEGKVDRARQLAIEALAIDPTCFAK
jgi:hypothetical protein